METHQVRMSMMKTMQSGAKVLAVVAAFALLSGCVAQPRPMYTWGAYQNQVNAHFKNKDSPEQQIVALQKSLPKAPAVFVAPPGYHAHLGLLYGETGRMDEMQV